MRSVGALVLAGVLALACGAGLDRSLVLDVPEGAEVEVVRVLESRSGGRAEVLEPGVVELRVRDDADVGAILQPGRLELFLVVDDLPGGRVVRRHPEGDEVVVAEPALLRGHVVDAHVEDDPSTGTPVVAVRFDEVGGRRFAEITEAHTDERLAVVLDGELLMAPRVLEPIRGGRMVISLGSGWSGAEGQAKAEALAAAMTGGELPDGVVLRSETCGP